jgi:hypothetical protein
VTIISTEFNKTIAAYTPLKRTSMGGCLTDSSLRSFLLQLDLKEKMTLIQGQENYAIYDKKNDGPIFGYGYDIYISDRCN